MKETKFEKEFKSFMKLSFSSLLVSLVAYLVFRKLEFPDQVVRLFEIATYASIFMCTICTSLITIGVILYLKKEKEKRGNKN